MRPKFQKRSTLKFDGRIIPEAKPSGIVPNSLWLLDNSTYSSYFAALVFRESHYDLHISVSQMPFRVHHVSEM